jgi:hypothetical protein
MTLVEPIPTSPYLRADQVQLNRIALARLAGPGRLRACHKFRGVQLPAELRTRQMAELLLFARRVGFRPVVGGRVVEHERSLSK